MRNPFFFIMTCLLLVVPKALPQAENGQILASESDLSQLEEHLELLISAAKDSNAPSTSLQSERLISFIEKLGEKDKSPEANIRLINKIFYKSHRKLLSNYENHATMVDLLHHGSYDCVSATSLYALIFDYLGFNYTIKEYDYHVLMLVDFNDRQFLIESTDPLGGLVKDERLIAKRLENFGVVADNSSDYSVGSNKADSQAYSIINNDITFHQLVGLQHYNNAIYHYNNKQPIQTVLSLKKAMSFYPSGRIVAFKDLALQSFLKDPSVSQVDKTKMINIMPLNLTAKKYSH